MSRLFVLHVDGKTHSVETDPSTPLLWVLRDALGLTSTKYGCGIGQCGACTVHIGDEPVRSCVRAVGSVGNAEVTTFAALASPEATALRRMWLRLQVPQCGYCQGGVIMAAAALLTRNPEPDDRAIDAAITNLCRCGTYHRIRSGIHAAAETLRADRSDD